MKDFKAEIEKRKSEGLYREVQNIEENIDFLSNDYLGFSKKLVKFEGFSGSTGSRLLSGNNSELENLERDIASFHSAESALLFSSGYMANLGLVSSVASRHDTLIMDELCHASLIDGAILSNAKRLKFKHNDLASLESKLKLSTGNKFIITEGVFSMDGSKAPVSGLMDLCEKHDAILILDEAHSIGVYGVIGSGICDSSILSNPQRIIRVMTYGKAIGSHGAAVVCSKEIKEYLINFSRPFIYTTAPPPHFIESIKTKYEQLKESDVEREKLHSLISYWKQNMPKDFNWIASDSQIQSLIIHGNEKVKNLGEFLRFNDIAALPIRKPTVKKGSERIRFCLHSYNTQDEIDLLFLKLKEWNTKT